MRPVIRPRRFGDSDDPSGTLAGSLLVAHPALKDENFRRTVILLTAHGPKDGCMGVILNRPLGKRLRDADPATALGPLGPIPLYAGGPVEPERAIFVGWRWDTSHQHFQIHFGMERDAVETMRDDEAARLRVFIGYAGWSPGQLEGELATPTWIVSKIDPELLDKLDGTALWRALVRKNAPALTLAADAPDHPDRN